MKLLKTLFYIFLILAVPVVFSACDDMDEPYLVQTAPPVDPDPDDPDNGNDTIVRKYLLEKFTGHRCVGCPAGDETAKILKDFYDDRLVVVSIHAGFFSMPLGEPYTMDFRTPEGNELNSHFGISSNPNGLISRREYEGSLILPPASWGSAIVDMEDIPAEFSLSLEVEEKSPGSYSLTAFINALKPMTENFRLVVLLTESGIVSPQSISGNPNYPEGVIMDYTHNNVLRKGITNIWGAELNKGALAPSILLEKDYDFSLEPDWVAENCHIVAFIMREEGNENGYPLEIMQVESIPLAE